MKTSIFLGALIASYAITNISYAYLYEEERCTRYEGRSEARHCVEWAAVEETNQSAATPEEKKPEADTEDNPPPSSDDPQIPTETVGNGSNDRNENETGPSSPLSDDPQIPTETVGNGSNDRNENETGPSSTLSDDPQIPTTETVDNDSSDEIKRPTVIPDEKTQPGVLTIIDIRENCDLTATLTLEPSNNSRVAVNKDGTVTYVANHNINGFDEFYYTCEKNGELSLNKVIVEVRRNDKDTNEEAVPVECPTIYAVHHQKGKSGGSRLLIIDQNSTAQQPDLEKPVSAACPIEDDNIKPTEYPLTELSSLHKGPDIVACQPQSGQFYVISRSRSFDGDLWEVNTQNQTVKFKASTGYSKITAGAFHRNGILYAWSERGIIEIKMGKKIVHANLVASAEELFGKNNKVEITSLAWSPDGKELYAIGNGKLWVWEFDGNTFVKKKKCSNLPNIDSLKTSKNGILSLMNLNQKGDSLSINYYDPENCQVRQTPCVVNEVDNDEENTNEENQSDAEQSAVKEAVEEKADMSKGRGLAEILGLEQPLKPKPSEKSQNEVDKEGTTHTSEADQSTVKADAETQKLDSDTEEPAADSSKNTPAINDNEGDALAATSQADTSENAESENAESDENPKSAADSSKNTPAVAVNDHEEDTLADTSKNEVNEKSVVCPIYAVHDEGESDSQFLIIEKPYWEKGVREFGPLYKGYNIEALEMDPSASDCQLYAISNRTHKSKKTDGHLYKVDCKTGKLELVGDTGFSGITALTFYPLNGGIPQLDGMLLGVSTLGAKEGPEKGIGGLVKIDPKTGDTELLFPVPKEVKIASLAWSSDGMVLYATEKNNNLWAINFLNKTLEIECRNFSEIEGLETLKDGKLLFAIPKADYLWFVSYDPEINTDPDNCMLGITEYFAKTEQPYDVESIAWPLSCQKTLKETIIEFLAFKIAKILSLENVRLEKSGEGALLSLEVAGQVHQGYFPQLLSLNEIKPNCDLTFTAAGDLNSDGYDDLEMHYGNDSDANCGPVQTIPLHYLGVKEVKGKEEIKEEKEKEVKESASDS
jgi:hypothetical protein